MFRDNVEGIISNSGIAEWSRGYIPSHQGIIYMITITITMITDFLITSSSIELKYKCHSLSKLCMNQRL